MVGAVQAVKGLLEQQSVDYEFNFYRLPIPADVPTTILSSGTSLLGSSVDIVVPLHATQAPGALLRPVHVPEACWNARCLTACNRNFAVHCERILRDHVNMFGAV